MKVAIIGAGISGLYLGWKLAERGEDVTIFEKKEKIGKEVCSGFFSERILEFIPESQSLILNKINFCLIHFPKCTFKINFSKKFFVMSHFELDNLVAKLAQKAGAKIVLNRPMLTSDVNNLLYREKFERIIGCDGANSIVRKSLGLPEPNYRLAIQGFIACEQHNLASARICECAHANESFVETWPTKNGFIWKIPRANEIEYGIIEKPNQAKKLFDEFLNKNNLQLVRIKSGIVSQGLIIPKNSKITLCGDASGLTKPWSGGGVVWSLIAANLLLKNFPDFLKYKKAVKKFFLPKIIFSKIITKVVYFLGFNFPWLLPKNIKIEGDFLL
jgi:flavin-dependent dehydrogenase